MLKKTNDEKELEVLMKLSGVPPYQTVRNGDERCNWHRGVMDECHKKYTILIYTRRECLLVGCCREHLGDYLSNTGVEWEILYEYKETKTD